MAETNTPNLDLLLVEKGDYYNYIKQHKENYVKIDTAVGEKQDTLNKNIRVTDDFNNYVDDGNYAVVTSDISSILNYPADLKGNIAYGYGCLTVKKYREGNYVVQTYRSNANYNNIFERIMYDGVWKSWAATYTERNKPAPSDIGALASGDVSEDYNTAEKIEDKIENLFEFAADDYSYSSLTKRPIPFPNGAAEADFRYISISLKGDNGDAYTIGSIKHDGVDYWINRGAHSSLNIGVEFMFVR